MSAAADAFPDLYAFYERCKVTQPPSALEALERFLDLWPVGATFASDVLYGNGSFLGWSTVETKEALRCTVENGRLWQRSRRRYSLVSQ